MSPQPSDIPDAVPSSNLNPVVDEWIAKARGDLRTASREVRVGPGGFPEAVCFHSQQAIEKAMNGAIIARGARPPLTHDLVALAEILEQVATTVEFDRAELRALTQGAVRYRYPGSAVPAEEAVSCWNAACRLWPLLMACL